MAVVKDFYIGQTHIRIDDSCCVKTQEEVDRILKNIARNAVRAWEREAAKNGNEVQFEKHHVESVETVS